MDIYSLAAAQIIKQQQVIIGPLAIDQARKVNGLDISNLEDVKMVGNAKEILNNLVGQYQQLFGQASVEVCKDALKEISPRIPSDALPEILK